MDKYLDDDEVAEALAEAVPVREVVLGQDDLDSLLAAYEPDTISEHNGER